jgi:formylglycine-generating enzyme required for sulfatase activity
VRDASVERDTGADSGREASARPDSALWLDAPVASSRSCEPPSPPGCGRVRLFGGAFAMGDADSYDYGALDTIRSVQHRITVSPFTLDRYEVTVGRFRRFVAATGRTSGFTAYASGGLYEHCNWTATVAAPESREGHPMNCIDWASATAFCAWDVAGGELPSEARWEFAARGTENRRWPWGGSEGEPPAWVCWNRCASNCLGTCAAEDPAYGMGATPEGIVHLVGNVWEWTVDWYQPYTAPTCWGDEVRQDPVCRDEITRQRAVRGGSWYVSLASAARSGTRDRAEPDHRATSIGFRCAAPP